MDLSQLLSVALRASQKASNKILDVYASGDFSIEAKADNSPLTRADRASHEAIVDELAATEIPILSEEGASVPFDIRKEWGYFWMIDPLDGTKEFIKRNGEFTVNIALIKGNKPVLGVVQPPVTGEQFYAVEGEGAYLKDSSGVKKLSASGKTSSETGLKVVASRSHMNDDTRAFVDSLSQPTLVSRGSSLKLLMVASGEADIYPRYAPTMEWDTAAAQIIVEAAGGCVLQANTTDPVVYNKENLLNPYFIVNAYR